MLRMSVQSKCVCVSQGRPLTPAMSVSITDKL